MVDMDRKPIVIDLPLPPDCLHPNARPHWAAKARATKQYRWEAKLTAMSVRPKVPFDAATYKLTFWLKRKRDMDGLIAWVKAAIDGIADAGIIWNDSEFKPDGIERFSGQKETGGKIGVRFEIYEAPRGQRA